MSSKNPTPNSTPSLRSLTDQHPTTDLHNPSAASALPPNSSRLTMAIEKGFEKHLSDTRRLAATTHEQIDKLTADLCAERDAAKKTAERQTALIR